MSLPIIQSLWVGEQLSKVEQLSIQSFIAHGHPYHLYCYSPIKHIPKGALIKDANEILPREKIFVSRHGSYAAFADYFRWQLLYQKGNYWADTDIICIKPIDLEDEIIFGKESANTVSPAFMRFPPGHTISEQMVEACLNPNRIYQGDSFKTKRKKVKRRLKRHGLADAGWGEVAGPDGFTKNIHRNGLFNRAKPFTFFYPIAYSNWDSIFDDTFKEDSVFFKSTYTIHLWNEMFRRRNKFDKNATFSKHSLIEQLKSKYLPK
jgi:hypothetical protein